MNQIQEKDWAEESWHSHTGIESSCDYCIVDEPAGKAEESGQPCLNLEVLDQGENTL